MTPILTTKLLLRWNQTQVWHQRPGLFSHTSDLQMFKNGPNPDYFCFLFYNTKTNIAQILLPLNDKSIAGVLGTGTWGSRMEGADESTELWRYPQIYKH